MLYFFLLRQPHRTRKMRINAFRKQNKGAAPNGSLPRCVLSFWFSLAVGELLSFCLFDAFSVSCFII